jgi:hypothetical protein
VRQARLKQELIDHEWMGRLTSLWSIDTALFEHPQSQSGQQPARATLRITWYSSPVVAMSGISDKNNSATPAYRGRENSNTQQSLVVDTQTFSTKKENALEHQLGYWQ